MSGQSIRPLTASTIIAAVALTSPGALPAPQASTNAPDGDLALTEVVVSARRSQELLSEVPISISALTTEDFAKRDMKELDDIAEVAPSFTLTSYGAQRARRDTPIFTIRGVIPASASSRPGAGVFVNGAPAANGQAAYLGDLERVEVIKGPQAAYFGRSTFAGAINLVPRRPSQDLKAKVEIVVGENALRDIRGSVEAAVGAEWLSARLSLRDYSRDGLFSSGSDGSTLTDQTSRSASLIVAADPSDDFSATLAILYNKNADGFPAYAKLNASEFNCAADASTSLATFNPTNQKNFICGELPQMPAARIGTDFVITPLVFDVLYNNIRGLPNVSGLSILSRDPTRSDVSETLHANLTLEYRISSGALSGFTVSYLGAHNERRGQSLTNSIAQPVRTVTNPYFAGAPGAAAVAGVLPFPTFYIFNLGREESSDHELRIASDPTRSFRGMIGLSYFRVYPFVSTLWGFTSNGTGVNFGSSATSAAVNIVRTPGAFGSLAWDLGDSLTLNLEGRYQSDEIEVVNRGSGNVLLPPKIKASSFMPRISVQYKPMQDLNLYVSYASGQQPRGYNTTLVGRPQNTAFALAQTGAGITYDGEQIDMLEVGAKGSLFDDRIAYAATIYRGEWTDQVISQRVVVPTSLDGLPAGNILTLLTNGGQTDLSGIELEAAIRASTNLNIGLALSRNVTDIKRYECVPCQINITGSSVVTGNSLPNSPKFKASVFAEYRQPISQSSSWYVNAQYIHSAGMYTDETNLARSNPRNTVDLRAGYETGRFSVEAFVVNLFDAYYVNSANRDQDIWAASVNLPGVKPALTAAQAHLNNAFYLSLGEPRYAGIRASYTLR